VFARIDPDIQPMFTYSRGLKPILAKFPEGLHQDINPAGTDSFGVMNMSRTRANQTPEHACHTDEEVKRRIEKRAYFIAKNSRFEPGHELDDWIEAESHEALDPGVAYPASGFQS